MSGDAWVLGFGQGITMRRRSERTAYTIAHGVSHGNAAGGPDCALNPGP